MAFTNIDPTTPAGTDKKKFGDDQIRGLKQSTIDNFKEISNYPAGTKSALRTAVWTTATRPAGSELVDRVTGYNTVLAAYEYYDLASAKWVVMAMPGLSSWNVAGRPSAPYTGLYGYNTDLAVIERWSGSAWVRVSGGRRGDIKMWSGAVNDIEAGWVLADGGTRTHPEGGNYTPPNLRDRFIVGAGGNYNPGVTGGAATHTLTIDELPSHAHTYSGFASRDGSSQNGSLIYPMMDGAADTTVTTSVFAPAVGGGLAHNNMPPYYALCYLYKL